ncbi:MAG: glucose-6-phosphate dehydrogenase assembly protein OpcA [Thermoleophilaceae bacterium]|nr:glucose-6-phosphate dehydrogenase assembly protein OpcA [Thermoleophilaceae bacterium]
MTDAGGIWSEANTTPGAIDSAIRQLLQEQYARDEACAPARVLNLVVVVDREWRGEVLNRLERVGRYHPSRLILCAVEEGRTTIDATVAITIEDHAPGEPGLVRERIVLDLGPRHLEGLDTIVDPLVVTDIATVTWSPHGHPEAVDALLHLSQVILVDSINEFDPGAAVDRARDLAQEAYIVDLAWLRSTPWRERVASTFDPPQWREELGRIDSVTVRHSPQSAVAGLLFCGWLAARLGWEPGSLLSADGSLHGKAHGRRQDVSLKLEPDPTMSVPGLAGVELGTAGGMSIALDRGPGGLTARRRDRKGKESTWTVLGASRGEAGILGEGIRQALLRDPVYAAALGRAEAMVG